MIHEKRIKRIVVCGVAGAIVVGCVLAVRMIRRRAVQRHRDRVTEAEERTLAQQIRAVKEGTVKVIQLSAYTGDGTDQQIERLSGLQRLEELIITRSDLTDEGLQKIRTIPSIERLGLFDTNVTDEGLAPFEHDNRIKALALVNTRITDKSLQVISTFQNLEVLVLFDNRGEEEGPRLSVKGLEALSSLEDLSVLKLGGPWLMGEARNGPRELRELMAKVRVVRLDVAPSSETDGLLTE